LEKKGVSVLLWGEKRITRRSVLWNPILKKGKKGKKISTRVKRRKKGESFWDSPSTEEKKIKFTEERGRGSKTEQTGEKTTARLPRPRKVTTLDNTCRERASLKRFEMKQGEREPFV